MPLDAPICVGSPIFRLRKHADYQRVYAASRKQFSKQMTYFAAFRPAGELPESTPRVGLTAGKVLGGAVERNRIKRRMREAVRMHLGELQLPLDVILHPRRSVLTLEFAALEREVRQIFCSVQNAAAKGTLPPPQPEKQRRG
ncbi:MAG: ribonuclease P protein component [Acidobacteriaceae bacterium]|jgi:ribonuclease P protein component|nr:ribonuclease P protein component [Acidobacteriaceae bacterium]